MNIKYRRFENDDLTAAAKLFQKAFLEAPWYEEWTFQQAYDRLAEQKNCQNFCGYVMFDGDELIGIMSGRIMTYLDYKELWIDELCISSQYQGKGIGSLFLEYIKGQLNDLLVSKIVLNTTKSYLSDKFYAKNGFQVNETLVSMYCHLQKE